MDSSFKGSQAWLLCWLILGLIVCNASGEDGSGIRPAITTTPPLEHIHQALKRESIALTLNLDTCDKVVCSGILSLDGYYCTQYLGHWATCCPSTTICPPITTCIPHTTLSGGASTASNPNAMTCSDPSYSICNTYIFAGYSSLTMAMCEDVIVPGGTSTVFGTYQITTTSTSTPKPPQTSHISAGAIAGIAIGAAVVGATLLFILFYFFLRAHRSRSAPPQDLARAATENTKPHSAELPTTHVGE